MNRRCRPRDDHGTALVGSLVGVVVFLAFLFTAVQLLTRLYATSTVEAVATDAARSVASRRVDHRDPHAVASAEAMAEADARRSLGAYARRARFRWRVADGVVRLDVHLDNAAAGFGGLHALRAFSHVDRTVVLQIEGR